MFFHGIDFIFAGIGVAIGARAIASSVRMVYARRLTPTATSPALLEDPRVPQLQAEVEELRTQVERLSAAESFYAQLNAPGSGGGPAGERPAG